jgi:hypothetical protein
VLLYIYWYPQLTVRRYKGMQCLDELQSLQNVINPGAETVNGTITTEYGVCLFVAVVVLVHVDEMKLYLASNCWTI